MSARPPLPSPTAAAPAAALHSRVLDWYAEAARDLPWRGHTSPWGVFVSEIMLQQPPVARVEPVWREWLSRWPSPADLAAAAPGDAVRAWGRLGYPRRALRLHAAATAMRDVRAGRAGEKLRGAEAIIDELLAPLDMWVGEIGERLQALYLFFKEHLMPARLKQDAGKVDEVAHFMRELRSSWAAVAGA